jgi:hypothetical protein
MAEKLTDGLRHQPQWTPPPGSSTDYDLNVELVEYFDRRLGEWKDGRVLARPQIPERDEIPAEWADLDGRPKYDVNLRGGGVVERTSFPSGYGKEPWPKVGYRVTVIPNEDAAVIRQAAAWADHVDAEQAAYEGGSTPILPAGFDSWHW